jgi:hypothetical protein
MARAADNKAQHLPVQQVETLVVTTAAVIAARKVGAERAQPAVAAAAHEAAMAATVERWTPIAAFGVSTSTLEGALAARALPIVEMGLAAAVVVAVLAGKAVKVLRGQPFTDPVDLVLALADAFTVTFGTLMTALPAV